MIHNLIRNTFFLSMEMVEITINDYDGFGFRYIFHVGLHDKFRQLKQAVVDEMYRYWKLPDEYDITPDISFYTLRHSITLDTYLDMSIYDMTKDDMIKDEILVGEVCSLEFFIFARYLGDVHYYIKQYDSKLSISYGFQKGAYCVCFPIKYRDKYYKEHFYIRYSYDGTVYDVMELVLRCANRKYDTLLMATHIIYYGEEVNPSIPIFNLRTHPKVDNNIIYIMNIQVEVDHMGG